MYIFTDMKVQFCIYKQQEGILPRRYPQFPVSLVSSSTMCMTLYQKNQSCLKNEIKIQLPVLCEIIASKLTDLLKTLAYFVKSYIRFPLQLFSRMIKILRKYTSRNCKKICFCTTTLVRLQTGSNLTLLSQLTCSLCSGKCDSVQNLTRVTQIETFSFFFFSSIQVN